MKTRPGEYRDTNINDARALGLYPSTTTIISIIEKPSISTYRVEQAIKATMKEPMQPDEDFGAYVKRMIRKSEEGRDSAASFGTAIHAAVCNLLGGNRPEHDDVFSLMAIPIAEKVCFWLDTEGYQVDKPEHTFVNERLGWAGTCDWLGSHQGKRVVLDFKSSVFENPRDAQFYREFKWQLASYALGLEEAEADRRVLQISRSQPGVLALQTFTEPEHDDATFLAIWETWKRINKWQQG